MKKNVCVFCASSNEMDESYYKAAAQLGKWLALNGLTLVCGGASCGLMEALAKSCHENGGKVIGIVPQILVDCERVSRYLDELIVTPDMHERKRRLIDHADVLVAMPGSVGTLDEVFTVLSSNTIGIHEKSVIIWNVNHFWDSLFAMISDIDGKGVSRKPMEEIIHRADTFEDLTNMILEG